jgi:hypothetical protein
MSIGSSHWHWGGRVKLIWACSYPLRSIRPSRLFSLSQGQKVSVLNGWPSPIGYQDTPMAGRTGAPGGETLAQWVRLCTVKSARGPQ